VGLLHFIELQQHLEAILGYKVDLGTARSLRHPLKEQVMKEAVRVA
jgi:predicted nucleotidyltransferase